MHLAQDEEKSEFLIRACAAVSGAAQEGTIVIARMTAGTGGRGRLARARERSATGMAFLRRAGRTRSCERDRRGAQTDGEEFSMRRARHYRQPERENARVVEDVRNLRADSAGWSHRFADIIRAAFSAGAARVHHPDADATRGSSNASLDVLLHRSVAVLPGRNPLGTGSSRS